MSMTKVCSDGGDTRRAERSTGRYDLTLAASKKKNYQS